MHANSTFHRQNPSQKQTFRNTLTSVILLKINLENSEKSLHTNISAIQNVLSLKTQQDLCGSLFKKTAGLAAQVANN
jgi:hypothetical protein